MNARRRIPSVALASGLVLFSSLATPALSVRAAGTIAFVNGSLTRVQIYNFSDTGLPELVPTTPGLIAYGVFWGTNADRLTLALPLGTNSTMQAGIIGAPLVFALPGTSPGQAVYVQVRGWGGSYGTNWLQAKYASVAFGETDIRRITLGPQTGPGTAIWQSNTGIDPARFRPLILSRPGMPGAYVSVGDPPALSMVVDEGNQGSVEVRLRLHRADTTDPGLSYSSTVLVSTADRTAVAGQDYVPVNTLVTFGPGESDQDLVIGLLADAFAEPDEDFAVRVQAVGGTSLAVLLPTEGFLVTIREARVWGVRLGAGGPVVTLRTTSTQRYALEFSPDLVAWSTVPGAQSIVGTGGLVEVTDPAPGCCGNRFYRAQVLP